jgi:hypothetical protein
LSKGTLTRDVSGFLSHVDPGWLGWMWHQN